MRAPIEPTSTLRQNVYRIPYDGFGPDVPSKETVGAKAHNLMRLARCALPVPAAFVLGTEVCRDYLRRGTAALDDLDAVLDQELAELGKRCGRYLGDSKRPLLVSVRSGAAISMPGMMETVLDVGLNDATLRAMIRMTGNPRLAYDCMRRLVQQYAEVVHEVAPARFASRLRGVLDELDAADIDEVDTSGLRQAAEAFKDEFAIAAGRRFPASPRTQLKGAIEAVLRSWSSPRAQSYRKLNRIPDDLGTAVIVQAMVYGNLSPASGSGVGFTRNPANGVNELYVDYLSNAQGEDVVAGRRRAMALPELQRRAPSAYRALIAARPLLEQEFGDMQDFEFTVEEDQLYLLQSRTGKRTPLAAARIACDLVAEGLISQTEALARVATLEIDTLESESLRPEAGNAPIARGTSASAGVVVGAVVFDPERVPTLKRRGEPLVLVRETAETSDIGALSEAAALVTAEGARTSHAAVVARQLGKVCVVGCSGVVIDASGRNAKFGSETIEEGMIVSVDGARAEIYAGAVQVVSERPTELLEKIASWRGTAKPKSKKRSAPRRARA